MVIVTGGTGYIGSHTCVELINNGYDVVVLDNLSNSDESVLNSIEEITGKRPQFFKVDIDNAEQLALVFNKIGSQAESIIHFAAKKAVGESVNEPLLYYRNNLDSLMNILVEMERFQIPNLVFSSSCTVYGQPDVCPVTEATPRKEAESPYGNTKSMCEDIIRDTSRVQQLKAISLRYFNPIGAHESAKIGELPVGVPNNLVPFVTQTAAGIRKELTIFGDDYDTIDGTCVRDYIHVVDLAKAHLRALRKLEVETRQNSYDIFNIGTGKGSSVLEVVNAFKKATGISVNYKIGSRRNGDITAVYADTTKANTELNWKSELGLEEALRSSWNWERNYRKIRA
ncbi:MAG: UDP-glucose 4-epimerase GalE [Flavobacteriales bacterium]|jgi:UDP-glucose 4-epimerase|nr:UDP-glucose 4-epimerase GalE [Flavobacteriales bacterium]